MRLRLAPFGILLTAASVAIAAQAQTHFAKCRDARGNITYSDRGCAPGEAGREMRTSGNGSDVLPTPGKPSSARSASGGSQARPKKVEPAASAASVPVRTSPDSAPRAKIDADDASERDRLQAIRQDYRRDVNRARNKAAEVGIPGFR